MKTRFGLVLLALVSAIAACSPRDPDSGAHSAAPELKDRRAHDYFSYANTDAFVTSHLRLDLSVDFERRELRGTATLTLRRAAGGAEIVLDTRDLGVEHVSIGTASGEAVATTYRFGSRDAIMGTQLVIDVPIAVRQQDELMVNVEYRTSPSATALQWLPPELTAGGKYPFLFSQSQTIHARSWIPLQDTPSVRFTYDATIHTPPELLALMSADNEPDAERSGTYRFDMPQPIPPYLLALAVGDLQFAALGPRTGVYAEPELLAASAFEFADTQAMLESAEAMFGPYRWGRYDVLILPPSFPFGGMENPRLSFLTPSLLAGDRSLVSVVAHELAHSWSGNLVTNATWRDGWLNEGWTSYLEYRLTEVVYGEERAAEEDVLGYRELLLDFETVPPDMQALAPTLEGGDPDDFQGTIHYHKGKLFLQYLEAQFGRDTFDEFLQRYFDKFAFTSITSEQFLDYLDQTLLSTHPGRVTRSDAEQWLYAPGLPADAILPVSASLENAGRLAGLWSQGEIDLADIRTAGWSPQAVVYFINSLAPSLPDDRLQELDTAWGLSTTRNAEIGRSWFIQVAERRYRPAYPALGQYLQRYGRTRLISPVYAALAENGADQALAQDLFAKARGRYHPLAVRSIDAVLSPASRVEP